MSTTLGQHLKIRSMVYVAGEPVPFFWPMRTFIHHNPLHGLEQMPFEKAVEKGTRLFNGLGFLERSAYQKYMSLNMVDRRHLEEEVDRFVSRRNEIPGIDLRATLMHLLTEIKEPVIKDTGTARVKDIQATIKGEKLADCEEPDPDAIATELQKELLGTKPLYEAIDILYGTDLGTSLDELVIKSCLDFFDEGQSVWKLPNREQGFFTSWRQVAQHNVRLSLRGLDISKILAAGAKPEDIIDFVMRTLKIPEEHWMGYFEREIARLHGWAGFIRWRSGARHYFWANKYPGDLVDFLAVRLTLALALLGERGRHHLASTRDEVMELITTQPREAWLRREYYSGKVLPCMAHRVEKILLSKAKKDPAAFFSEYFAAKRVENARSQAEMLSFLFDHMKGAKELKNLPDEAFASLFNTLREFEKHEGMIWLKAMEAAAMSDLIKGISLAPPEPREKRPFAQAIFCIDTRSERIRRQLETVGDYQTFGMAGFFGVPVSLMALGRGSEIHLCPALLTPRNMVLEMPMSVPDSTATLGALEKALHSLKESILTPFVTVEAIGLLFGFDMIGKTVTPHAYNRWRQKLNRDAPKTRLMLDKLTREQADSIVRAVQRAVIAKAVEQELEIDSATLTDDFVRELREMAMGHAEPELHRASALGMTEEDLTKLIECLREDYRINPAYSQLQMEELGRIGFTLDEQANFVGSALKSIGLTRDFSRFVLLVGHGSSSENNPYESALDCGACGGNHGLVSARVLAQMANKPEVRRRLNETGFAIPDDAWFVPALHNTTTDEITMHDLDLMPGSHLIYLDRLQNALNAASRLCARERLPTLNDTGSGSAESLEASYRKMQVKSLDWSQVRPEWGLSGNAWFIIGGRNLTRRLQLAGRAFLHSYDYRLDRRGLLLENIFAGPLVVGQWINMEHYFSTVDNERYGSGSKVYHNVAGRVGVMTGNLSDLRTGLPAQTVFRDGEPYHQPIRLITIVEAPFEHARRAIDSVVAVKNLVRNNWLRMVVIDPETEKACIYIDGEWHAQPVGNELTSVYSEEYFA